MANFDQAMQLIVNMDDEEKVDIAVQSYAKLYPTLRKLDPKGRGLNLAFEILGSATAADGDLTAGEVAIIQVILERVHGFEMTIDEAMGLFKVADRNSYRTVKALSDTVDSEGLQALVTLIAAICSIDDRISEDEVAYLRSLLN